MPQDTQNPIDPKRDAYLSAEDSELLAQSEVDKYRARGPGGQKRNKTDSAVRLRHKPTHLISIAVESRSQHQNRAKALKRLRRTIALQVRAPIDPARYEPGPTVAECLTTDGRLQVGLKDHRYNLVLAEVLDLVKACGCRVSVAARKLGISTARLVAFLSRDLKLKARVNELRTAEGIKPLR